MYFYTFGTLARPNILPLHPNALCRVSQIAGSKFSLQNTSRNVHNYTQEQKFNHASIRLDFTQMELLLALYNERVLQTVESPIPPY